MTNDDSTKAYIYYDVLNQYGESVRASENIEWTVSGSKDGVDKTTGKITVSKSSTNSTSSTSDSKDTFTYGTQIYVTGVHVKSGKSISKVVTTGMSQSVDEVKFAGFLNKNDKTKILKELPKDFAKNTYVLLYTTSDQNGNPLDVSEEKFAGKNLTFICDSPLLIKTLEKDSDLYTVDGTQYAAVKINPGQYVDKGGEVNITAISNITGKKSVHNFVLGAGALLKSIELSSPVNVVADGDTNVKIPYTAKDTEGNTITNYETIVRSTNELKLTASEDTTLYVKEEDDGTAGFYWSDDTVDTKNDAGDVIRKAQHKPNDFSAESASNDVDRSVSLTTVVVGGESHNVVLSVSDTRRPSAIKSIKLNDDNNDAIVDTNLATIAEYKFIDQYGAEMNGDNAKAFFVYTATHTFKDEYYALKVDVPGTATCAAIGLSDMIAFGEKKTDGTNTWDGFTDVTVKADANDYDKDGKKIGTTSKKDEPVKFSIARSKDKEAATDKWNDASKVKTVTYTVLPITDVKNPQIKDISKKQLTTTLSTTNAENGSSLDEKGFDPTAPIGSAIEFTNKNFKYEVIGTYDGKTVTIPYNWVDINADSAIITKNSKWWPSALAVTAGAISWGDLYNFNAYKAPRKDTEKTLSLTVWNTQKGSVVKKDITLSDEPAAPVSIKFVYNQNDGSATKGTLKPTVTEITYDKSKIVTDIWRSWNNNLLVVVEDQYGNRLTDKKVEFTVSDVKENTDASSHKENNFVVNSNGTDSISIKGAEVKDTFKLTATVAGTKISATADVTVTADSAAQLSSSGDSDKALRAEFGYDR